MSHSTVVATYIFDPDNLFVPGHIDGHHIAAEVNHEMAPAAWGIVTTYYHAAENKCWWAADYFRSERDARRFMNAVERDVAASEAAPWAAEVDCPDGYPIEVDFASY